MAACTQADGRVIDQRIMPGESEIFVKRSALPVLSISHLRVARGSTVILQDISWTVARRQHWAILGPNGCGKTSLLRALTGYLTPTSGTISVLGRTYGKTDWRALRVRTGLVTTALQTSIPPTETAMETVISGKFAQLDLWTKITPSLGAAALKLLRIAGASHLAERSWAHLSQGERQRVLIARALMARPELLILDEPCAGLDPLAREHFLGLLDRLARRTDCPALILVTHHIEEITPAFSHTLLLRAGRVIKAGPVRSTLTNRALAETFGTDVRLARRDGVYRLTLPRSARNSRTL
jgi:iron complex transport system ATP-binding protein